MFSPAKILLVSAARTFTEELCQRLPDLIDLPSTQVFLSQVGCKTFLLMFHKLHFRVNTGFSSCRLGKPGLKLEMKDLELCPSITNNSTYVRMQVYFSKTKSGTEDGVAENKVSRNR